MIKKLGRFIMLGVAIALLVISIIRIIKDVQIINEQGGWNIIFNALKEGKWDEANVFIDFGWGILYALVGLSALSVAVSGHAGFWTFIASGLMLGFFIFNLVTHAKAGDWKDYILNLSSDVIMQLVYAGGLLIVMYGNHREKKAYREYKKNH